MALAYQRARLLRAAISLKNQQEGVDEEDVIYDRDSGTESV